MTSIVQTSLLLCQWVQSSALAFPQASVPAQNWEVLPPCVCLARTVFRRLGGRLGPAARLSGGQEPSEAAACPADGGASRSASPEAGPACPREAAGEAASSSGADPAVVPVPCAAAAPSGQATCGTPAVQLVAPLPPSAEAAAADVNNSRGHGAVQMAAGSAAPQAMGQARPLAPHPALSPVGEDGEEETVPITANPLARRVLAGRQSLAPPRLQLQV